MSRHEGIDTPVLVSPVNVNYGTRNLPNSGYGQAEVITFDNFSKTSIATAGKLFSKDFAQRTYQAIYTASTEERKRVPLALFTKECLWIKNQMEALNISNDEAIKTFLQGLKGIVENVRKNIVSETASKSPSKQRFLEVLEARLAALTTHIAVKHPDLDLKKLEAKYPADISSEQAALPQNYSLANYKETKLTDSTLFSAAFANSIYERLILMSQNEDAAVMYESAICADIKSKIEAAKTAGDIFSLASKINVEIKNADKKGDTPFSVALTDISKNIRDYITSTYPEVVEKMQSDLESSMEKYNAASDDACRHCFWMVFCGVNATVQLPLNLAWFGVSVGTLGLVPCVVGTAADCFNDNFVSTVYKFKGSIATLFAPCEQTAELENTGGGCCSPCVAFFSNRDKYSEAAQKSAEALSEVKASQGVLAVLQPAVMR